MAPCALLLARSPPRLGRSSQAGGLHPRPPGLRPWRLRAPGPCCLGHPAGGGSGHGCDGGGGGQPLAVVHARRLAPPPLPWIQFFKARQPERGKPQACPPEGVSPRSGGGGGQTPAPPAGRLSTLGQRGLSTAKAGHRAERQRHPAPGSLPRRRRSALCRFIRENDSCEFGKTQHWRGLEPDYWSFSRSQIWTLRSVKFDTAQSNFQ